jgi:micrococcal nuclease
MSGSRVTAVVAQVTDGDTLRVEVDGHDAELKLRILGLDTEEKHPGGGKPVTPWGKEASRFAEQNLPIGSTVTLELPGTEPLFQGGSVSTEYLDNFGRLLAHVHTTQKLEGTTDFTEAMISLGYSPYFTKYGRADFAGHDQRYREAERRAQMKHIGVWNQQLVNGVTNPSAAPRNYAQLSVWWELRARTIDEYRAVRANNASGLFNTRRDYDRLQKLAKAGEQVTVFMELRSGKTVGGNHYVIQTGSTSQPFSLFLPNEDDAATRELLNLLHNRYITDDESNPRRNYAYITGRLSLHRDRPQLVATSAAQVSDNFGQLRSA